MPDVELWDEGCPNCRNRRRMRVTVSLDFHQMTDRGRVRCQVAVPQSICARCGFEALDDGAKAIMDQAVAQEYAKLPPATSK